MLLKADFIHNGCVCVARSYSLEKMFYKNMVTVEKQHPMESEMLQSCTLAWFLLNLKSQDMN